MKKRKRWLWKLAISAAVVMAASLSHAADFKIVITQSKAGDAALYRPLVKYLGKKGVSIEFVSTPDYTSAAEMFAKGTANAMFTGSGIAGTMMIKGLAEPAVRPVYQDGTSTYSALVIAPNGSPPFTGAADYFNGKKVAFAPLASAGEFFYQSIGRAKPKEILRTANHGAALDVTARGIADVAIVKNHVWTNQKSKYPQLTQVGGDTGQNVDSPLIVSTQLNPALAQKIVQALIDLKNDTSEEAMVARNSLKIEGYVKATDADFKHTLGMLKKAGVNKDFAFRF